MTLFYIVRRSDGTEVGVLAYQSSVDEFWTGTYDSVDEARKKICDQPIFGEIEGRTCGCEAPLTETVLARDWRDEPSMHDDEFDFCTVCRAVVQP